MSELIDRQALIKQLKDENISLEQLRQISKIIWGENNGLE